MGTSITFENATLSEAVRRIERVTPKKGEAFDKAAGIVFDIDPSEDWPVAIRATNLEVFYREWLNTMEVQGGAATWRLPASILASVVSKLPIATGKMVRLSVVSGNTLQIESGRFKAKIGMMDPTLYPSWEPFDPSVTSPTTNLGGRVEQVAWATARGVPGSALSAVRMDGKTLIATDRYKLVSVPLEFEGLDRDLVVPLNQIGSLVKELGDPKVGVVGSLLALMPNEYTQITCTIYGVDFPKIERVMDRDHPNAIRVERLRAIETIERVVTADSKNRMLAMEAFVGAEELAFFVKESDGVGSAGDVIELPGQAPHPRYSFYIQPQGLVDALSAAPSENVDIHYDPSNNMRVIRITGGMGYECWIVPLKKLGPEQE